MDYIALGLAIGMANALLAVGIVLTYMSTRVINLAHGELGAFCVAVMLALTRNAGWNYWAALAASLAATGLLGGDHRAGVVRRLEKSPRLIVLIATLGVAQLVIVGRLVVPKPKAGEDAALISGSGVFPVPFRRSGRRVRPRHLRLSTSSRSSPGPLVALHRRAAAPQPPTASRLRAVGAEQRRRTARRYPGAPCVDHRLDRGRRALGRGVDAAGADRRLLVERSRRACRC